MLMFAQHGIKSIKMDDMAHELGISKRTIYENFKDKNELVYNCLLTASTNHKKEALNIINNSKNVIDALFNFGEFNRIAFSKIHPSFFPDLKKYHPEIYKKTIKKGDIRTYEITYVLLKRGVNEGIFSKEFNLDLANIFIHKTMDIFQDLCEDGEYSHKDFWLTVYLPYIKGISTEKGIETLHKVMQEKENFENK